MGDTNKANERIPGTVDRLLTILENGERPWFLKITEIISHTKVVANDMPCVEWLIEEVLPAISTLTQRIEASTRLPVGYDVAQLLHLCSQCDTFVKEQAIIVDDDMDELRAHLAVSLRGMLSAYGICSPPQAESSSTCK